MSDTLCEINLSDIDLEDHRYKISPDTENVVFLADSIKKIGLITPPVIRAVNKKFVIISGFNRIRALLYNKEIKSAVYLTDNKVDDVHCLLVAITALSFRRALTHGELIISVKRLSKYLDKKKLAQISPAVFNTQLTPNFITDLQDIGSLPDPGLELIHTGHLSLKSAKKLSNLDMDTMVFFLDIFSKIKVSVSIQLELIQNILEISAREGFRPPIFFHKIEVKNPLDDKALDPILKAHRFRTIVFETRFPTLSQARQYVLNQIMSTKLPGTIKLIPPENFESREYSVSFMVKNYEDFQKNVQYLTDVMKNKTLKEILNP